MTPYYDEDGITIYHGEWICLYQGNGDAEYGLYNGAGLDPIVNSREVGLLLTDPPYGIDYMDRTGRTITGDTNDFDPRGLLVFPRIVIWGADNFSHLLPQSRGWIVWSKVQSQTLADVPASVSNVELAWSNVARSPQLFNHYWRDWIRRASERGSRLHPALKPVSLMKWILEQWTEPGDLVFDPYMGSGPIAKACHDMGRRYIGVEIEERYCEIAVQRLAQGVLSFD